MAAGPAAIPAPLVPLARPGAAVGTSILVADDQLCIPAAAGWLAPGSVIGRWPMPVAVVPSGIPAAGVDTRWQPPKYLFWRRQFIRSPGMGGPGGYSGGGRSFGSPVEATRPPSRAVAAPEAFPVEAEPEVFRAEAALVAAAVDIVDDPEHCIAWTGTGV